MSDEDARAGVRDDAESGQSDMVPDVQAVMDSLDEEAPLEPAAVEEPPAEEPVAAAATGLVPEIEPRRARIPAWPFWSHAALWVAFVGFAAYSLVQQPDVPTFRNEIYPLVVLGGVVLTVLGPLLAMWVWFAVWLKAPEGERGGLLSSALLRGSAITLFGVLAWWGMLVVVDALRLGLIPF